MSNEAAVPDHMSDFEALMWTLEKSPALSNTFSNVTVLDRPPDRHHLIDIDPRCSSADPSFPTGGACRAR